MEKVGVGFGAIALGFVNLEVPDVGRFQTLSGRGVMGFNGDE